MTRVLNLVRFNINNMLFNMFVKESILFGEHFVYASPPLAVIYALYLIQTTVNTRPNPTYIFFPRMCVFIILQTKQHGRSDRFWITHILTSSLINNYQYHTYPISFGGLNFVIIVLAQKQLVYHISSLILV